MYIENNVDSSLTFEELELSASATVSLSSSIPEHSESMPSNNNNIDMNNIGMISELDDNIKQFKTNVQIDDQTKVQAREHVTINRNICILVVLFILYLIGDVFYCMFVHSIEMAYCFIGLFMTWLFLLFPLKVLLGNVISLIGPLSRMKINSTYYSAIPSPKPVAKDGTCTLPHVTVQIPVYTEDLLQVIIPTVQDVFKAMNYYRRQGGTCNLFINDDGLNGVIDKKLVKQRIEFYEANSIGYVARPKANRKGIFKKASNMNYCNHIALQVKTLMKKPDTTGTPNQDETGAHDHDQADEKNNHDQLDSIQTTNINGNCNDQIDANDILINLTEINDDLDEKLQSLSMPEAILQVQKEFDDEFMAGGDVTLGDLVLLLDADTRLPETCIFQTVGEFSDEQVAFTQHHTKPMRCEFNYWENAIAFFTDHVYEMGIAQACANGDVSPLVGHNAMLRTSALQAAAIDDVETGRKLWWSESHVSEDFDCALRLMAHGFYGRYVTYTTSKDGSFEEGVSLTHFDELIRLRKYAYGCCEVVFNKFKDWRKKGIFSQLFKNFLKSNMPIASKIGILAYMGTYFAMASAIPFTIMSSFIWSRHEVDQLHKPFDIFAQVTLLFGVYVPLAAATFYYRRNRDNQSIFHFLWEEVKGAFVMWFFWAGILYPILTSMITYFLDSKIAWGATRKTIDTKNADSIKELKYVMRSHWKMYVVMILQFVGLYGYHYFTSIAWSVHDVPLIISMISHVVSPILLNPIVMRMNY